MKSETELLTQRDTRPTDDDRQMTASLLSLAACAALVHRAPPPRMCEPPLPAAGGTIVKGDETIMCAKAHGSTATPVQEKLRWGVKPELAEAIGCHNRNGAEPNMYFTECIEFTKALRWSREQQLRDAEVTDTEPIVFYDSVSGFPLFVAPVGRDVDAFLSESLRHGWPSFRLEEVVWDNVRVLDDFEVVSTAGTHLGHQMPDADGRPRFCINLCSIADEPSEAYLGAARGGGDGGGAVDGDASSRFREAWPLLHELAAAGCWSGVMHYATGPEALSAAPFVLRGTTRVKLTPAALPPPQAGDAPEDDEMESVASALGKCVLTSSAVMPNGVERTVAMAGELSDQAGSTVRFDKEGGGEGPIYLLLSEHAPARTLLVREVNATTGEVVVASSLVLVGSGDTLELIQTAHELAPSQPKTAAENGGAAHAVQGVQMWRMVPRADADAGEAAASEIKHDTEAFMYSGSEL